MVWKQGEYQEIVSWRSNNFFTTTSELGAFILTVISFTRLIMFYFKEFSFELSMVKRMYSDDRTPPY